MQECFNILVSNHKYNIIINNKKFKFINGNYLLWDKIVGNY